MSGSMSLVEDLSDKEWDNSLLSEGSDEFLQEDRQPRMLARRRRSSNSATTIDGPAGIIVGVIVLLIFGGIIGCICWKKHKDKKKKQ